MMDPFNTPPETPGLSLSAVPPPLPPRPSSYVTSHRKPVPKFDQEAAIAGTDFPPLPPPLPSRPHHVEASPATQQIDSHVKEYGTPVAAGQNPRQINEKLTGFTSSNQSRRKFYPTSRRGKIWFWSLLGSFSAVIAIIIIAVVTIKVLSSRNGNANNNNSEALAYNGGHPLSIADGGVDIGQPGDIPKYGSGSTDHFILRNNRTSLVTRLDPIVNPGKLGNHLHRFFGSSYLTPNIVNASVAKGLANCTTVSVQSDHSNYWIAQLFYRYPNGSYLAIPSISNAAYYFMKAPTGQPIYPFPDNFNIVAGDPRRRSYNDSNVAEQALWWNCQSGGRGNDTRFRGFPNVQCPGGLNAVITFPSCWDGVVAPDGKYASHVSYTTDGHGGFRCPPSHPMKLPGLKIEMLFDSNSFPFNGPDEITWVLSNGDTSGYGIHADFMNGWDPDVLKTVVEDCRYMNKTSTYTAANDPRNCPVLEKSNNYNAAWNCRFQESIVHEAVGVIEPIPELPGCNALWVGNVTKPPCPNGTIDGGDLSLTTPTVWLNNVPYIA